MGIPWALVLFTHTSSASAGPAGAGKSINRASVQPFFSADHAAPRVRVSHLLPLLFVGATLYSGISFVLHFAKF